MGVNALNLNIICVLKSSKELAKQNVQFLKVKAIQIIEIIDTHYLFSNILRLN